MKRLFWLGVGVAVGALVVHQLVKKANSYTPQGIAESARSSVAGLADSARQFVDEVRESMAEREDDLLTALSTDGNVAPLLDNDDEAR